MNKTVIKNFAVWARTKLRDDIKIRAGFLGINEDGIATPLPASTQEIKYFEAGTAQPIALSGEKLRGREKIVEKLQKKTSETDYKTAYDLMVETYASDWFNRFVALRFMEVNERFSDNMRVLSSSNPDRHDPDIVSQPFSSELEFTDKERADITEWKTKNETDKLFRFMLIKKCNQLSKVLPGLFEEAGDESELMMRQSFIDKDGVIYRLVNDIDEEDWKDQVQIIGWLYQYYNTELKDETFALAKKGKKITKERVPSATQLFTPDWIVRYMVQNSLGRLWLEGHIHGEWANEAEIKAASEFGWKYYLAEENQTSEVAIKLKSIRDEYSKLNPEELTFIDPSMGSGHILVYAFDVLMQIYESVGYTRRDAAKSIVENNIYGLDIDDRAYQLAYFAVMMKACEYDGRFLDRGVRPHIYSIQESNSINRNQLKFFGNGLSEIEKNNALNQMLGLLDVFIDAKEYGSILNVEKYDWNLLTRFVDCIDDGGQISMETIGIDENQKKLQQIIAIAKTMSDRYWVTCTNPPYLGGTGWNAKLDSFIKKNYDAAKTDLYSVFIDKCNKSTKVNGYQAMITQHGWMFLSSFEKLRRIMLDESIFTNLVHLGPRAFDEINGEVVQSVAFVFKKKPQMSQYKGSYIRLVDLQSESEKERYYFDNTRKYACSQDLYSELPGIPIAYWCSENIVEVFKKAQPLSKIAEPRQGVKTLNNDLFLKLWFEVQSDSINYNCTSIEESVESRKKWFPYNKGGTYRKWYGNNDYLVNWYNDGYDMKKLAVEKYKSVTRTITNISYFFKKGLTWSSLASGNISLRAFPEGYIFDSKGSSMFFTNDDLRLYVLALINSKVSMKFLEFLAPTLDFNIGPLSKIPVIIDESKCKLINGLVSDAILNAKKDWDSFETSWDFLENPLVAWSKSLWDVTAIGATMQHYYGDHPNVSCPVELCWMLYKGECEERFAKLKNNEEEINSIFIDIYGLQDELTPEENDSDVTVRKADLVRDIKNLVSYAVGCMLGRYSLNEGGIIYAGGVWDISKYTSFQPDADNIIPITDARYMDDDIVDRFCEWLKVVFGEECLEDNLTFIANTLGTKGTDSRDILRNYFLNEFFKDHCQTYSVTGSGKRPIYWLFDSGKQNAFKVIVYMHRIDVDTIGRVRISYLHPLQEKYENEVRSIDTMIQGMTDQRQISAEEKRREKLVKQIAEIKEYDEKLDHLAQERIEIDLDDGVKVNYEKIQTDRDGKKYQILAPIK